jgi:hypothetical protein
MNGDESACNNGVRTCCLGQFDAVAKHSVHVV